MWPEPAGAAADVRPGRARCQPRRHQGRLRHGARLRAAATGESPGRHEVLQERHEAGRNQRRGSHR